MSFMLPSWKTREHVVLHCLSHPGLLWTTSLDLFRIFQFKHFLPYSAVLHGMQYKNSSNSNCFIYSIILLLHVAQDHVTDLANLIVTSVQILMNISNSPIISIVCLIWKVSQLKTSWKDFKTKLQAQLVSIKHHSAYNPQCWCWHEDSFYCLESCGIKN